ncbi:MAG TPA: hypothetical protein PKD86_11215 [Gemmatales bacterium]|nr:hypothetical protein [Gemmatales bacterium]HMP59914.1 hypothetical protein [Gemmatales bacterium]
MKSRARPLPEVAALLDPLRSELLELHRLLIEAERQDYERAFGPVAGPGALLQLLIDDPWFSWLRPFAQLIVRIDESLEVPEPISVAEARSFLAEAWALLAPAEQGLEHQRRYYQHLQDQTPIVMAHGNLKRFLVAQGMKP